MLPEDAGQMPDLRALTRELMTDAESDLGAKAGMGGGRSLEHR
jgi:hypothetical protein